MNSFFILSSARSGSTSLAKILNTSSNSICQSEPMPNLNIETRLAMEGKLTDDEIYKFLEESVIGRSHEFLKEYEVYGEKNVTYAPFITKMYEKLGCKFVFLKRDGRDVVTSMMNWHEQKFGNFYKEANTKGNPSNEALISAQNLLAYQDTSDFARPRPLKNDSLYNEWNKLSRFEMCSYYWSYINELYLKELSMIPKDAWFELDYTNITPDRMIELGEFLGLDGLEKNNIDKMLNQKINSLSDRNSTSGKFLSWNNWDNDTRDKFDRFASDTMYKLDYYKDEISKWKPDNFGEYWKKQKGADNEWFEWMYDSRKYAHDDIIKLVEEKNDIESIADFGCGTAVGYCEAFKYKDFFGIDISADNINWCIENRKNPSHQYLCQDFIKEPLSQKVDLVFSSGTIDNCYDVKEYLTSMVKSSKKYISFTLYRGWFPDLDKIEYNYNPDGYFYNNIGVSILEKYLKELGCTDISITPLETGKDDIIYETRVVAHV
jgi:hypothetical protein